MLAEFGGFLEKIIASTWNMLNSSSPWIIFSFLVAGLLHEFLKPEKIQKTAIGSGKISGVFWTTISGMFIPICSCGTIPLGISMYYSGAYLGPTLAFMTSTPMINPIALLLAYGLLGKEIATIYLITGFVAPMVIGMIANKFAGNELHIGLRNKEIKQTTLETDEDEEDDSVSPEPLIQLEFEEPGFWDKIKSGMRWSFTELSVTICKYTVSGMRRHRHCDLSGKGRKICRKYPDCRYDQAGDGGCDPWTEGGWNPPYCYADGRPESGRRGGGCEGWHRSGVHGAASGG